MPSVRDRRVPGACRMPGEVLRGRRLLERDGDRGRADGEWGGTAGDARQLRWRRGTIAQVTGRSAAAQHLRDLAVLRRVRDRIDREYAVCFTVGCSSLGTFSSRFTELVGVPPSVYRLEGARATAGMPPCIAKRVTRPIRNREASVAEPHLS